MRFEARDLDDIRALGGNDLEDERTFATVARVSEINLGLYRTFLQPWVRAFANEASADWLRRLHPLRLQYELFSDANPFMRALLALAEQVREHRQPVAATTCCPQAQAEISEQIEQILESYGEMRDRSRRRVVPRHLRFAALAGTGRAQGQRRQSTATARHGR